MGYSNIQEQIIRLKNEILALKTAQKVSPNVKGYYYAFTPSSLGRYKVTYEDGDEPVMTEAFFADGGIVLSTVTNDVQYFWIFAPYLPTVELFSNRPIKSVVYSPE